MFPSSKASCFCCPFQGGSSVTVNIYLQVGYCNCDVVSSHCLSRWCFYFFCFFTFIPVSLFSLSLPFISSAISSVYFLPFSGRRHKMTHKGWRVVKPQLNQKKKKKKSISSITTTRLFKYIENFTTKNWKFSEKNSDIFHISAQNIDCVYSLEPPRRGGSNKYPQYMFWAEIRKICIRLYTPVLLYRYKGGV